MPAFVYMVSNMSWFCLKWEIRSQFLNSLRYRFEYDRLTFCYVLMKKIELNVELVNIVELGKKNKLE